MLNLIITHSPRMAAMAANKRLGADVEKDLAARHRADLRRNGRAPAPEPESPGADALHRRPV